MPTDEELNKGFVLGDWEVLPARGVLRSGDQEEHPEPKVFGVLMALARRDGDLVTRDELIDELWDGRPTSDEPINRCLSQLRRHLGDRDKPYRYIETLTRRGYRLRKKVRLNQPASPPADPTPAGSRKKLWIAAAAVAAVLLLIAVSLQEPHWVSNEPIQSIGVLPFENLSNDADDLYLVSGFKEELVHTLNNIPDFAVKGARVNYPDHEVTEIAGMLDVDAVLFGGVQRNRDVLKISYEVADGRSGISVSSGSITGRLENIFALQEQLAAMVRNEMLGESPRQLVSTSRPANFQAYDRYMRGLYAFERRGKPGNLEEALRLFEETIELDPNFGPAYLQLATAYALLPDHRSAPLEQSHAKAIEVVEQGIAVDTSIVDAAGAVFGFVYHKRKEWAKAEEAYLRATQASVVDSNAFNWYSRMLASVGRLDDALDMALEALRIDPTSAVINSRVAIAYTWLGNSSRATEFFDRVDRLDAVGATHLLAHALLLVRDGHPEQARAIAYQAVELEGGPLSWIDPVFAAFRQPDNQAAALAAIDRAVADEHIGPLVEVTARTMLGDVDGAMRIAWRLVEPGEVFEMDLLFIPEFRPLREHPEFAALIDALGIARYWNDHGCIWRDDRVHCQSDGR